MKGKETTRLSSICPNIFPHHMHQLVAIVQFIVQAACKSVYITWARGTVDNFKRSKTMDATLKLLNRVVI